LDQHVVRIKYKIILALYVVTLIVVIVNTLVIVNTIGQYVQFVTVSLKLITYLYTHEGCKGRVTLKDHVLMMCTKEGGDIIIARNTDGIVELQTKRGNKNEITS
jgi:hypothetical protein